MQVLESAGEFFSETAMRQRAPGLWHEHIGRHEGGPPPGAEPPAAGETWAASLLRANDAAEAQMAIEAEAAADRWKALHGELHAFCTEQVLEGAKP